MVTLVMVDKSHWSVSRMQAIKYCSTPDIARKIVDILTEDKQFQRQMRILIDKG